MLSYIANINTAKIIQKVCKRKNILILSIQEINTDIKQYIKETKVNFNLIKYLIVDISNLNNTETEIIESIYNFSKLYTKTKIIILAPDYNNKNTILTNLYDLEFYNIINESEETKIEEKLNIAIDIGLQKKDSRKFEKVKEKVVKNNKIKIIICKLINTIKANKSNKKTDIPDNMVYLFSLILEAVTRLIKFICYILVFCLTSIGLTISLNSELREIVFKIFGLK